MPFHILCPVDLICNLVMGPLSNDRIKAVPNGQTGIWGLHWERQNVPSKGSASKGFGLIPVPSLSNDLAYDSLNFIITVLYADCIKNRHFQNLFAGLQWKVQSFRGYFWQNKTISNSVSTKKTASGASKRRLSPILLHSTIRASVIKSLRFNCRRYEQNKIRHRNMVLLADVLDFADCVSSQTERING